MSLRSIDMSEAKRFIVQMEGTVKELREADENAKQEIESLIEICIKSANETQDLTQQLAEANAHIEQLRESLAILVDLLAHKDESYTRAMPDAWDVARGCLELTPAQSLQEVKVQTLEEIKGEPVAWMLTKFGGFQPDDQQEYLDFVHIDDVDKYEPKLSEFIKHGLAVPLFDMQQLRQQGEE